MSRKDINKQPFTDATMLKLEIFRRCFREWFPVFVHHPHVKQIFIYDMFAGSGTDTNGNPGSPIILLEEAIGNERQHCSALAKNEKNVIFGFNEKVKEKKELLEKAKDDFLQKCKSNCPLENCIYSKKVFCKDASFEDIMKSDNFRKILANNNYAKFVLLDQYGFSQITEDVFLRLVSSPFTYFIFFISVGHPLIYFVTYISDNNYDWKSYNCKEQSHGRCHWVSTAACTIYHCPNIVGYSRCIIRSLCKQQNWSCSCKNSRHNHDN